MSSSSVTRSAARSLTSRLALSCIALAVLSACNRGGEQAVLLPSEPPELTWARAALERNPRYEVLASDSRTRVFTVRDRASGQVETINLNDLAAGPIAQLMATPPAIAAAPPPPPPPPAAATPAPPPAPTASAQSPEVAA
ncbi:MAG: hypothetical protein SXG53_28735, partial [Pseudomonadota bacterium]|nr:hypothetical protein [Pseudomonadota bacterium]